MWEAISIVLFGIVMFFAGAVSGAIHCLKVITETGYFEHEKRRYVVIARPKDIPHG
jgi:hypothetical protein